MLLGKSLTFLRISVRIKETKIFIFSPHISTGLWLGSLEITDEKLFFYSKAHLTTCKTVPLLLSEKKCVGLLCALQLADSEGQSLEEKGAAVETPDVLRASPGSWESGEDSLSGEERKLIGKCWPTSLIPHFARSQLSHHWDR